MNAIDLGKSFCRGSMRTYLLLKDKAARFNADAEIQALLADIRADDGAMDAFAGPYSPQRGRRSESIRL